MKTEDMLSELRRHAPPSPPPPSSRELVAAAVREADLAADREASSAAGGEAQVVTLDLVDFQRTVLSMVEGSGGRSARRRLEDYLLTFFSHLVSHLQVLERGEEARHRTAQRLAEETAERQRLERELRACRADLAAVKDQISYMKGQVERRSDELASERRRFATELLRLQDVAFQQRTPAGDGGAPACGAGGLTMHDIEALLQAPSPSGGAKGGVAAAAAGGASGQSSARVAAVLQAEFKRALAQQAAMVEERVRFKMLEVKKKMERVPFLLKSAGYRIKRANAARQKAAAAAARHESEALQHSSNSAQLQSELARVTAERDRLLRNAGTAAGDPHERGRRRHSSGRGESRRSGGPTNEGETEAAAAAAEVRRARNKPAEAHSGVSAELVADLARSAEGNEDEDDAEDRGGGGGEDAAGERPLAPTRPSGSRPASGRRRSVTFATPRVSVERQAGEAGTGAGAPAARNPAPAVMLAEGDGRSSVGDELRGLIKAELSGKAGGRRASALTPLGEVRTREEVVAAAVAASSYGQDARLAESLSSAQRNRRSSTVAARALRRGSGEEKSRRARPRSRSTFVRPSAGTRTE